MKCVSMYTSCLNPRYYIENVAKFTVEWWPFSTFAVIIDSFISEIKANKFTSNTVCLNFTVRDKRIYNNIIGYLTDEPIQHSTFADNNICSSFSHANLTCHFLVLLLV